MTDRDPLTVAREVVRQHGHLDRDALSRREKERLDLARAVIDLTAKVRRMEALADELERLATWERTPPAGPPTSSPYADGLDEAAARIRDALTEAEKEADQ